MRISCLLAGMLSLAPRLIVLFFWLFTPRIGLAFGGFIIPLLGFLFLPFTMTAYLLVWSPGEVLSGIAWLVLIGGIVFDIASYLIGFRSYHPQTEHVEVSDQE